MPFAHAYPFDPSCGMQRDELLGMGWPEPPNDFETFWRARHAAARALDPAPRLSPSTVSHPDWIVHDIAYTSTDGFTIAGWLIEPRHGRVTRGLVVGHGYGGRGGPEFDVPVRDAAILFPCFRGLSRSARPPISQDPRWHVLHDIDKRDAYIIGGCVEDLWLAVSALLALHPQVAGHVGYSGISFGGGLGGLALAWDDRIACGHLMLPTFGHQPLRLVWPSSGSAASVQDYERRRGGVLKTLSYYDAASAARFITQPMHIGAAVFDPAVAPPGQFAIHNALRGCKNLFILDAGHFDYPRQNEQQAALREQLTVFFGEL